jgi:hypothetical protein
VQEPVQEEQEESRLVTVMSVNPTGSRMENFRRDLGQLWKGLQPTQQQSMSRPPAEGDESTPTDSEPMMLVMHHAGRAAMAWIVVYVILFFLLLGYKWQAKDYYQTEYELKLAKAQQQICNTTAGPWWVVQGTMMDEAMTGIRELTKLQDAELKTITQRQYLLQEMKQRLEQLDLGAGIPEKEAKAQQLSGSLDTLLQRAALAEIPSSTVLNHLFGQAIADLKQVLRSAETFDWATVQAQLSAEFPPKQPSVAEGGVALECRTASEESSIPSEAARQSDLDEQVEAIEALLEKRVSVNVDEGLPGILSPQVFSSLESSARQRVHNTLRVIIRTATAGKPKASRSSRSSDSSCLESEDVLEIVEEGLLALQQNANLRNVLRKKAIELDPSTTSISLDADLPLPTPKIPRRETTNLGRFLDTPLVLQLARGIDHLIELGGGYNDQLDHWLDSVAGGRESIGEMVVRQLLEESGKIEIPNFQKVLEQHLPREAHEFLKKSKVLS